MTLQGPSKHSVIVVGGGASGMAAAISAARAGARVTLLERLDKVGKKILVTGNGRCNLTNTRCDTMRYFGSPNLAMKVIDRYTPKMVFAFFKELGLECVEEDEGRVYPLCQQASAVLDVLRYEMERLGVVVKCGEEVVRVSPTQDGFVVRTRAKREFSSTRVILTAGGKAAPKLGTDGAGFSIAQALGHTVMGPSPGLVQLNLKAPFLKSVDGVRFNGEVAILCDGRIVREERGEILFTTYGVSGIPILQLSRVVGEHPEKKTGLELELRLYPDGDEKRIRERLTRRPEQPLSEAMVGCVHKRLIPPLLKAAGVAELQKTCGELGSDTASRISKLLRCWRFPISGTQPWDRAQVTAGGVSAEEIDPQSLQSRKVPGLYFAGEIVDVDGDCGGYNLQWAWASGLLAGLHAAEF